MTDLFNPDKQLDILPKIPLAMDMAENSALELEMVEEEALDISVSTFGAGGGSGTSDHNRLQNLDFENSGHTGFASEESIHYTNSEATTIDVGGIKAGTTFNNVSIEQIITDVFYAEVFPAYTNPTFTIQGVSKIVEVNESADTIVSARYSPGTVTPTYGGVTQRGGNVEYYKQIIDNGEPTSCTTPTYSSKLTNSVPTVLSVRFLAHCAEGPQMKGSKGSDYLTPYPEKDFYSSTITTSWDYAYWVNGEKKDATTARELIVDFPAEAIAGKNTIKVGYDLEGVYLFNTIGGKYDKIQLSTFDKAINGAYRTYTHNGAIVGARRLKFVLDK